MKDPRRLLETDALPRELREALQALELQAPGPEAIARVQRSLARLAAESGPPADAAPNGSPASEVSSGAGSSGLLSAAGAGKLVIVGALAALATSAAIFGKHDSARPHMGRQQPAPSAAPARAVAQEVGSSEDRAGGAPPWVGPPVPAPKAAAETGERASASVVGTRELPARATSSSKTRADARAKTVRSGATASITAPAGGVTPAQVRDEDDPAPQPTADKGSSHAATATSGAVAAPAAIPPVARAPEQPPATVEPRASGAASPREPAGHNDEAALLYRAKLLAASDPEGALRLLAAHARQFSDSLLAQEREMLAIRLHTRLGHAERAKELTEQFRARFPDSVYRSALLK